MTTILNRWLRTRWGFPLLVLLALAGIAANEWVHRHAHQNWSVGTRAEEVYRQAHEAHYHALDRVNSLRAYLLDPQERWIARYRAADAGLEKATAFIIVFLGQHGAAGRSAGERLSTVLAARNADADKAGELALAGRRAEALAVMVDSDAAGRGVALRSALQQAVEFARAERTGADAALLGTITLQRWLVHAFIAAILLAAYVLWRQARSLDAARRQRAEQLSAEVAARTAQLRELAGHMITTREDERTRLARELHDEMGALLSATKLDLARLRRHAELPPALREHALNIDRRVSEVVDLKRRVIESLRPSALEHLGLGPALDLLCRDNAQTMGVATHADIQAPPELHDDLALTLYRLVQEALTNARKYSQASELWVSLKTEAEQVQVSVEDNGIGFDEKATGVGHHGLAGMRLRVESHGGRLNVGPRADGRGARIHAAMPIRARPAEA
jgi:signal transduction histidine kinase